MSVGFSFLLALAALLQATPATERQAPDQPPSAMSNKQIAEWNKGLTRDHPQFINCRSFDQIGSWAKKNRVCRTNQGWRMAERDGNDNARETLESMRRAPVNGGN